MKNVGQAAGVIYIAADETCEQFEVTLEGEGLCVTPWRAMPYRRILRPVAHFDVETAQGGYPELNLTMGRVTVEAGDGGTKRYRPFSRDPARRPRALYVGPERPAGDDPEYFNEVCSHFFGGLSAESHPWVSGLREPAEVAVRAKRFEYLHYHAHGWFHLVEMQLLDAMVRASVCRDKHVVEIGSYQGRSTAVIAGALGDCGADSLIFSLDPNDLSEQQADMAAANVASVGQRRRLVQIQRPAAQAGGVFTNGIAQLAFIDGSHEYPDVLADFQLCDRLLASGGILLLHDVYAPAHLGYEPPRPAPAEVVATVILPTGRYVPLAGAHLTLALQKS